MNKINNLGEHQQAIKLYCTNANYIKDRINEIINKLINNVEYVPYSLRALCAIIMKNYQLKHKDDFSLIDAYAEIGTVLYERLISFTLSKYRDTIFEIPYITLNMKHNLTVMNDILTKLFSFTLFHGNLTPYYTKFNELLIELTPKLLQYFEKLLSNVELPQQIND